jgi:hypothetical protein
MASKLYKESVELQQKMLKDLIDQAHKDGYDLPDKIKEQLKNSPIGA